MVLKAIVQKANEKKDSPSLRIKNLDIPLTDKIPSEERKGQDLLMISHPFYTFMAGCDYSSDPQRERLSRLVKLRHNLLMQKLIEDSLARGMQVVMALPCEIKPYEERGEFQLYCPYKDFEKFVFELLNRFSKERNNLFAFPTNPNDGFLLTVPEGGRITTISQGQDRDQEINSKNNRLDEAKKHLEQIAMDPLSSSLMAPLIQLFPQGIYLSGEESEGCFSHFSSYSSLFSPSRIVALARNIRPYWFPEFEITDSELKRILGLKTKKSFLKNADRFYWNEFTREKIERDLTKRTFPDSYINFLVTDKPEELFPQLLIDFGENTLP